MSVLARCYITVATTVCFALFTSCVERTNIALEKEKILSIMASMREAHFQSNAAQFLEPMQDSFVEIRQGSYKRLYKSESLQGIQSYFGAMEFLELEDMQDPILEISDDASMATYTGSIIVKGYLNEQPLFNKLSWQSILRKFDGEWKIISNVNTSLRDSLLGPIVLNRVQQSLGLIPDSLHIAAFANCSGPTDPFQTLVRSSQYHGRMEQLSSDGHIAIQHGKSGSWMMDYNQEKLEEPLDEQLIALVKGHEFHWLSLRPEDRFQNPLLSSIAPFEGQLAFEVSFDDPLGRDVVFYYDFESYLPLGFRYPSHREGEMILSQFSDWTEIDGIPVFQKVTIEENDNRWEYDFTEIRLETVTESMIEDRNALL